MIQEKAHRALSHLLRLTGLSRRKRYPSDFSPRDIEIISRVRPYTMTSDERLFALMRAVEHVVKHDIPGGIVECGVWKGGSMMAAAQVLLDLDCRDRELHLFDTFEGMPEPTDHDVSHRGEAAAETFEKYSHHADGSDWCLAPLEEVEKAVLGVGYDRQRLHFVPGKVEDTLPSHAPDTIALLRLDTDWYESTYHEFVHLYPRLSPGGVLILDDYGYWQGARQATDEYLAENNLELMLQRIDHTGRIAVKPYR